MDPLAIALATLSAVTHAWRELHTKKAHDKQIFVWLFTCVAVVMYFPLFLYYLISVGVDLADLKYAMLASCVHCVYWYFLSKAYEEGDLSHVYPLMRSSPVLVLLFAVAFLGEKVSMLGVVGIFVILAGVYSINLQEVSKQGFFRPLRSLRDRPTRFALLTAVTVALYSITDKVGVSHMHPVLFLYITAFFVFVFNTVYIFAVRHRTLVWDEWKRHPGMIITNGFLTHFSYLLILIAFTFERASYVTSIRQLSVIFGVLLGGHLLQEKHKAIRFGSAGMILVGAVLISLAP